MVKPDACARNIQQAREIKDGRKTFQVGPTVYRGLWVVDGNFLLEAARYLAEKKIRLVGIDYISVASADPMENVNDVHKAFLGNGIYILEALNLAGIKPGKYELIFLPLRIEKGDAGPCRVILKKKALHR